MEINLRSRILCQCHVARRIASVCARVKVKWDRTATYVSMQCMYNRMVRESYLLYVYIMLTSDDGITLCIQITQKQQSEDSNVTEFI